MTAASEVFVALGIDEAFVPHAAVTIASAAASTRRPVSFLLLHNGVSDADRRLVERSAPKAGFHWFAIDDPRVLSLPAHRHIATSACYFRLMLPRAVPDYVPRIIYLDSDTVVTADISDL
jgi:lipopolysaccharide biosynthesis glycosyltransferase